jgi:hypothetical protein
MGYVFISGYDGHVIGHYTSRPDYDMSRACAAAYKHVTGLTTEVHGVGWLHL